MGESVWDNLTGILSFGPRAVGSPQERAAGEWIAKRFAQLNLAVMRREFFASFAPLVWFSRLAPLFSIILLVIAGFIFFTHPLIAAVLILILLAQVPVHSRLAFGSRFILGGSGTKSANISGSVEPAREENPTLILVAHYDTKAQTWSLLGRFICVIIPLALCAGLLILAFVEAIWKTPLPRAAVFLPIAANVVLMAAQMVSRTTNRSPGAIDNGSGVAVLLTLAHRLPARLKEKVNLVFLASGAEELGLIGAKEFIHQVGPTLDRTRTLVVNFDSVGTGSGVSLIGCRRVKEAGRLDRAFAALRRHGFSPRFFPIVIGVGMDHIPFCRFGLAAVSVTQTTPRVAHRVHTAGDRIEILDPDRLHALCDAIGDWIEDLYTAKPS